MRTPRPRPPVAPATLVVAAGAGALSLLAFAPFDWFPLVLASPCALLLLWRWASPGLALLQGWAGGLGLLLPGTFWLRLTGLRMNTVSEVEAAALTIAFVAFMALFYGVAGWVFATLRPKGHLAAALLLASLWTLADWTRGRPGLSFPTWLGLGYSQVDQPLAGFAPVLGLHGVTFLLVLTAGLLPALRPRSRWVAAWTLLAIWLGGAVLRPLAWTEPAGPPLRASLIQASLFAHRVWTEELHDANAAFLVALTRAAMQRSDVVIWPESALAGTEFVGDEDSLLRQIEAQTAGSGKHVILNAFAYFPELRYRHNRVLVRGDGGRSHYDKRILVPVGEFMPRGRLLDPLWQWLGLFHRSDVRHGEPVPPLVRVGAFQAGVAVCYEMAFGGRLRTALPEAAYLVNLANDSWFAGSLEPEQHLQMVRMRALETRRWVLRATLTGHTVILNPWGRITARAPLGGTHLLGGKIQPLAGATPYARWGDTPILGLSLALVGWSAWARWRRRPAGPVRAPAPAG